MSRKYRIAMLLLERAVRPECHGWHYAAFMDECKPMVMFEGYPENYFWFTNGDRPNKFFYINNVEGFKITKIWDIQSRKRAEDLARLFVSPPQVCETIEETYQDVDAVFLADGGGDGSLHLPVVKRFLERGIPAFIDKPFAHDYEDAKAIVQSARSTGTPFFTASILSHVNEVRNFKNRWAEIPPPGLGIVRGYGAQLGGIIHGFALAQAVFGTGVDWVECLGEGPEENGDGEAHRIRNRPAKETNSDIFWHPEKIRSDGKSWQVGGLPLEIVRMHYAENDLQVLLVNTLHHTFDWFTVEVWGREPEGSLLERRNYRRKWLRSEEIGDPEYLHGTVNILRLFKQMLDTGQPPVAYDVSLELIATVEAARKAQRKHGRVYLEEITSMHMTEGLTAPSKFDALHGGTPSRPTA